MAGRKPLGRKKAPSGSTRRRKYFSYWNLLRLFQPPEEFGGEILDEIGADSPAEMKMNETDHIKSPPSRRRGKRKSK